MSSLALLLTAPPEDRHGGPPARLPELAGIPDAELVQRLRAGDEQAFATLYRAYYPRLVAVARTFVDRSVAEELAQDVLTHLWQRREQWEVAEGIGIYLYAAVRNRARKHIRHNQVVGRVEQVATAAGESPAMGAPQESVESRLDRDDIRAAVDTALAHLSEGARTAFLLRWMHELSYPEIARIMETTEMTARKQVSKARQVVVPILERFARQ